MYTNIAEALLKIPLLEIWRAAHGKLLLLLTFLFLFSQGRKDVTKTREKRIWWKHCSPWNSHLNLNQNYYYNITWGSFLWSKANASGHRQIIKIPRVQTNQQYDGLSTFENMGSPLAHWNVQAYGKMKKRAPPSPFICPLHNRFTTAIEPALYAAHASACH